MIKKAYLTREKCLIHLFHKFCPMACVHSLCLFKYKSSVPVVSTSDFVLVSSSINITVTSFLKAPTQKPT